MAGAISTTLNIGLTSGLGVVQKLTNLLNTSGTFNGNVVTSYQGTVVITAQRNIATIIPDVTIEEISTDELEITQHPIEQGSPITDHAFKKPETLTIRAGWSDASNPANNLKNPQVLSNGGSSPYIKGIYQNLLTLQNSFQPFGITTGKRVYTNMLMKSLVVETNRETEAVLIITAQFQEVLLATTSQVTTTPLQSTQIQNQTYTAVTAAPVNSGVVQTIPAPTNVTPPGSN